MKNNAKTFKNVENIWITLRTLRKTMQKASNNLENHRQCLGKKWALWSFFAREEEGGPWARGALHARGFAHVAPLGLQASPWHPQRLPGPLGPGSAAGKRNFLPSVCVAFRGVENKTHKHSVVGLNRKAWWNGNNLEVSGRWGMLGSWKYVWKVCVKRDASPS